MLNSTMCPGAHHLSNHKCSYISDCNLRQQQAATTQSLNSLHF